VEAGDRVIPAPVFIDEVRRLGGSIVLVMHVDRPPEIELDLPQKTGWLVDAIREHKPEVVSELRRRYLTGTILSQRVN
jgi:hypothetical protein